MQRPSENRPSLHFTRSLALGVLSALFACSADPADDMDTGTNDTTPLGDTGIDSDEDSTTGMDPESGTATDTDMSTDSSADSATDSGSETDTGPDTDTTTGNDEGCETPDPGWANPQVGAEPKHFDGINFDGVTFNLCDFAGDRIVVDISATWCGPCRMWADVVSGVDLTDPALMVSPEDQIFFMKLQDAVNTGAIKWMTYLADPGTMEAAAQWAAEYPHEEVPVFIASPGEAAQLDGMFVTGAWPNFFLVNEDFTWESTTAWPTDLEDLGWI